MKKKKDIIRVGDRVEIVEPHIFIRCGYPKTVDDMIAEVEKEHGEVLRKFVKDLGLSIFPRHLPYEKDGFFSDVYEEIRRAVAYAKLKAERFGGSRRSVHTEYKENEKGRVYMVGGIRFVKSGTYEAGGYYGGMDGYEYEPAYLTNQKTHKILRLAYLPDLEIEAIHVKKVQPEEKEDG